MDESNPDATGSTPAFVLTRAAADERPAGAGGRDRVALRIDPTIDRGLLPPLFAVGDHIWFDADQDGQLLRAVQRWS